MENIIKMVLSIDQKASNIMKDTHDLLETREKDVKEKIESMKLETIGKTKSEAKSLFESIVKDAESEAENIKNNARKECNDLEDLYLKLKDKIELQLFSQIVS